MVLLLLLLLLVLVASVSQSSGRSSQLRGWKGYGEMDREEGSEEGWKRERGVGKAE